MARIPTPDELGYVQPTATRPIATYDATPIARGISAVGNALSDVADLWRQQDNVVDIANAEATKTKAFLDQQTAFKQRTDYQNFAGQGQQAAKDAVAAGASVIRDPTVRAKWTAQSNVDAVRHASDIQNLGIAKERDATQAAYTDSLEQMRRVYADPNTPDDVRTKTLSDIRGTIDMAEKSGLVTPEIALGQRKQFIEGAQVARLEDQAVNNPQSIGRTYAGLDRENGFPVGFLGKAANAESDNTGSPTGSQRGIFQFKQSDIDELLGPGHSPDNPQDNLAAMIAEGRRNKTELKSVLGRDPTAAELFLAHNQGLAGAKAILSNPDRPILDVLSQFKDGSPSSKVTGNGGSVDQTAGQFAVGVMSRFDAKAIAGALPGTSVDLKPYLVTGKNASAVDGLSQGFKAGLAGMFDAMPDDLKGQVKIGSGFRSPQEQADILAGSLLKRFGQDAADKWQGYVQAAGGDVVKAGAAARPWLQSIGETQWVAPPGASNHQKGQAADLQFGSDAAKQWVHANAERFGLKFRMDNEDWHIEPMTVSDVASNASRQFDRATPSDRFIMTADTSGIAPETRLHIQQVAQRSLMAQEALANAQFKAAQDATHDRMALAIENNDPRMTRDGINSANQSGQISDQQTTELLKAWDSKEKTNGISSAILGAMASGGQFPLNPYDEAARKGADGVYDAAVKADPSRAVTAIDGIQQTTGIVPPKAVSQLRGAMVGTDVVAASSAMQVANNLMMRNPNVFSGIPGGDDVAKKAMMFRHSVEDLGYDAASAAQRVQASDDPQARAKVKISDDEAKSFRDTITKTSLLDPGVGKLFDTSWWPGNPQVGQTDAIKSAMLGDFAELATDFYRQGYSQDDSKAMAAQQLKGIWGVSKLQGTAWNGTVMKYPPELRYPPAPDKNGSIGFDYIREQAADFAHAQTGKEVDPKSVVFIPVATETAASWNSNRPVPYQIMFTSKDPKTGQTLIETVPGKNFTATPSSGIASVDAKNQASHAASAVLATPEAAITTPQQNMRDTADADLAQRQAIQAEILRRKAKK